jgi:hypothetical protein
MAAFVLVLRDDWFRRISPISSRLGEGRLTETDSGRSTWKTRTGLHAPLQSLSDAATLHCVATRGSDGRIAFEL